MSTGLKRFVVSAAAAVVAALISGCPGSSMPATPGSSVPASPSTSVRGSTPLLPERVVDTTPAAPTGRTITVSAGGDFQSALDEATPGDLIVLQAGAVFTGPFVLPYKPGQGWITIESNQLSNLPPEGTRVAPSDSQYMPKLVASSGSVITTVPMAHNYRFVGIEIEPASAVLIGGTAPAATGGGMSVTQSLITGAETVLGISGVVIPKIVTHASNPSGGTTPLVNLVMLGEGDTSESQLPNHIIFDRCYLQGDPIIGTRRGIAMNSAYTAVINSYLSDFKALGQDSQAIASWNGAGPFKIQNDYLEAAGENVIFGGQDPTIHGLVPSDIEILGNDFSKPLSWESGTAQYQGQPWDVKNLLELKNAARVLIEGNVLSYNWAQSQDGFGVLFTVRNQNGTAPWSDVRDVTFIDNVLRHSGSGINILGYDNDYPSQQTQRILIKDNIFHDIGYDDGAGVLFQILDGASDVTITQNTAQQTGDIIRSGGAQQDTGFVFTDNIVPENQYGIIGTGTGIGDSTLQRYFPNAVVKGNVFIGGQPDEYPSGNSFPSTAAAVGFVSLSLDELSLSGASPYAASQNSGTSAGADVSSLCAALRKYGGLTGASVSSCGNSN